MMFNDQKEVLHAVNLYLYNKLTQTYSPANNNNAVCFYESFALDVFASALVFGIM